MASSISFGQVSTIGGKTVLSGSQSGIDTTALVKALTDAKALPATKAQDKITANQAKITALSSLKTALQSLQSSVDALRNPTFGSSTANAFLARTPFLTATNGKTVSDYVGVTTSAGAPIGKYTLEVDHLATAESRQSISFTDRISSVVNAPGSNTAGAFAAGTFQINGSNVTVKAGDSLNNVASAINSVTGTSGVTASIIKFSDTDFRLILNAKDTGAAKGIVITDASHVLPYDPLDVNPAHENTASAPGSTNSMFSITKPAADAQIQFNNQTVTRPTNTISDLLDNVSFSLYGKTNSEIITLDIDKDNTAVANSVGSFVDAYNAVRTFQASQNQRDSTGALLKTSILANDSTLNTVMNQIGALISGQASIAIPSLYSSGNVTTPKRMGDLGISLSNVSAGVDASGNPTPAVTNTLTLDPSKLNTNLESFFDNVANIFQFNFNSSSPTVGVFKRSNTLTQSNFNIAIDTTQPIGSQAKITSIDGAALTSGIELDYKTTTTQQSSAFNDKDITSVVNAAGTDTAGAFAEGIFKINGEDVTLTAGMKLTDVMNAINLVSNNSGVKASIVKNGNTDFRLVLVGTDDGTNGVNFIDTVDHVLPSTSLFTTTGTNVQVSGRSGTDLAGFNAAYNGNGNETISRGANITSKNVTVDIDTSRAVGQKAQVTKLFGADLVTPINMNYTVTGSSATIAGISGTAFDGLQLIYSGDGTDVVDLSMSQGIADKLFNSLEGLVKGNNSVVGSIGTIDEAIKMLTDSDTKLQASITTINDQVSVYRDQLLTKFAALEAAISASNQLLQLLSAQTNAALVNSGH